MELSKMKNIIVLKGMASNVVDEAIVVLKPNVKLKQSEYNTKGKYKEMDKNKKIAVVKEAETTIDMYVKKLEKKASQIENDRLKMKYKFLQACNIVLVASVVIATLLFV